MRETQSSEGTSSLIWQRLLEAGQFERHFNQLQATYRGLASTWLPAAFAGIGFTLIYKTSIPGNWPIATGAVAVLGAVGLVLVWIIDMLVYHQLLNAIFFTAMKLENENGERLQFRTNIVKLAGPGGVSRHVTLFYLVATNVLLFVATVAGFFALTDRPLHWPSGLAVGVASFAGLVVMGAVTLAILLQTQRCHDRVVEQFPGLVPT